MNSALSRLFSKVILASLASSCLGASSLTRFALPDDFIQQVKLVGTGGTYADQGWSVALSTDGNTLAVGGPFNNDAIGAVWIFKRLNSTWVQEAELVGTGYIGAEPFQGSAVSLSADGSTLAIGASNDNSTAQEGAVGATWIFTRSDITWSQQAKLIGADIIGNYSLQGYSVSVSADGNTLAVGGPYDNGTYGNGGVGATWIFVRSGTTWIQQAKIVGTDNIGYALQGWSVALSSDGNTLAVGGPYDNGNPYKGYGIGAVWIFTRVGTTWTQQAKLIGSGSDYPNEPFQGWSVALSADGNTLASGGPTNRSGGGTWIFIRLNTTWTEQAMVVGTDTPYNFPEQGASVSLSADGNVLAIGGPDNDSQEGAKIGTIWIFTRSGTVWSQQAQITGADYLDNSHQGYSVSLSGDSTTLAIGGPFDNGTNGLYVGATWIFDNNNTNVPKSKK